MYLGYGYLESVVLCILLIRMILYYNIEYG
jgi:hypothetical protein